MTEPLTPMCAEHGEMKPARESLHYVCPDCRARVSLEDVVRASADGHRLVLVGPER